MYYQTDINPISSLSGFLKVGLFAFVWWVEKFWNKHCDSLLTSKVHLCIRHTTLRPGSQPVPHRLDEISNIQLHLLQATELLAPNKGKI